MRSGWRERSRGSTPSTPMKASAVHALSIAAERFRGLEGIDPDLDQMSDLLNEVLLQLREACRHRP